MSSTRSSELGDNLLLVKKSLVVNLVNNVDCHDIEVIEDKILSKLVKNRAIKCVIVGMAGLQTADPEDLARLAESLSAFRLLGAKIGLCGINPGIAAIMIRNEIDLPYDTAGHDLDHVLENLK
jgi:anti-anti-sigma regulatory factor